MGGGALRYKGKSKLYLCEKTYHKEAFMRKRFVLLGIAMAMACAGLLIGCDEEPTPEPSPTPGGDEPTVELSDDASFDVLKINDCDVSSGYVWMSEAKLNELMQAEDVTSLISVDHAEGSTLTVDFDKEKKEIDFFCVAEDGVTERNATVKIQLNPMFGGHSVQNTGAARNGLWNNEYNGYLINGTVAALDEDGENLVDNYAYQMSVTLTDLSIGSEIVLASYQTESLMIRYVLRGLDDTHYLLFTDYKENSGFLNYYEIATNVEYQEGDKIEFGVVNLGNSMVMIHNGETVFHRTLHSIHHSELVLSYVMHPFVVNDIQVETDAEKVEAAHSAALADYEEPFIGPNSIGFDFHTDRAVKNNDESITINGADSNERVMGGYFYKGVPVGGHEFAVSVSVRMQNTRGEGTPSASKTEFQLYKDSKNSIKFHMFRHPTNNTLMGYENHNGVETDIAINKNNFPTGSDYTYNIIALYKNGYVELWLHDNFETNSSVLYEEYTLVYSQTFDWNHCGFAFAMRQYADTTWSDWQVYYNGDFAALFDELHPDYTDSGVTFSSTATGYQESPLFTQDEYGEWHKDTKNYGKAFIANNGTVVSGNQWIVNLKVSFTDYLMWGQGEFQFYENDMNAVRYVFEWDGGNFQVFTERKTNNVAWGEWTLVRRPHSSTPAYLNMTAVNDAGNVYLLINGKVWHKYENTSFSGLCATFGGKDAALKVYDMSVVTDAATIDQFVANMEDYVYESSYEGRIQDLEGEYANAEKGGIVLAGSSSVDFWNTWQEDLGNDVLAYNVGIGGTTTYDWQIAYDRLIKPMQPSQILLFLGGNDVNGLGETGANTALRLQEMLELMHTDFPQANIVYVLSMPVPNNYRNGEFTLEYGRLVEAMKAYGELHTDWLKTVDLEEYLTEEGVPVPEYFRADDIHLSEAGYAIWTQQIKPLLVHDDTVMKDKTLNVIGGGWSITENPEGNKVYTSTADGAWLNFTEIVLENNAVIEFDLTILDNSSSVIGIVFGLDSPDDDAGFCVGRVSNGKPGDTWMLDGAPNGYGNGDTTYVQMPDVNTKYHVKIECDIEAASYDLYVNGTFARHLYFAVDATNPEKDTLHTGKYFGLYGGKSGGRSVFENITVGVKEDEPEQGGDETPDPEETNYNILGGAWEVTENPEGNKVYTSTANYSYLVFKDITLANNAVVEFDLKVLQSSSYTAGVVFGLATDTSLDGCLVGRLNNGDAGSAWFANGDQGTYAEGGDKLKGLPELNTTYHIKVECDIAAGTYKLYVDGEPARELSFVVDLEDNKTANDVMHTGAYFGLFSGRTGRMEYSNITVSVPQTPEQGA